MCTRVCCFWRIRTTAVLPGPCSWGMIHSILILEGGTFNWQLLNQVLAFLFACSSSPLNLKLGLGPCCHLPVHSSSVILLCPEQNGKFFLLTVRCFHTIDSHLRGRFHVRSYSGNMHRCVYGGSAHVSMLKSMSGFRFTLVPNPSNTLLSGKSTFRISVSE